jgi:ubiquinol-cytochrome c reductase iron-sulfur subunit
VVRQTINLARRRFLVTLTTIMGGIGAVFAAVPFVNSWFPSARAQAAGGPVKVDVSHLAPDERMTVEWRGKPVWIIRRDKDMLTRLENSDVTLRDPDSSVEQQPEYAKNVFRSRKPEYLILVGVCTHLGCSPNYVPGVGALGPNWPGGFYCPCHGSKFDLAGRVFTGVPAPINLQVPPYKFLSDTVILIGDDSERAA